MNTTEKDHEGVSNSNAQWGEKLSVEKNSRICLFTGHGPFDR